VATEMMADIARRAYLEMVAKLEPYLVEPGADYEARSVVILNTLAQGIGEFIKHIAPSRQAAVDRVEFVTDVLYDHVGHG
jgi:hypothetical protein